jgi:DNA-binding transcriptional LysR family regulator
MDVELRHLRLLCAIADSGSLRGAARSLGHSQQAISAQLRRIERHFGGPLFERNAAGVRPTQDGLDILAQSRDVVARADAIMRSAPGDSRRIRHLRLAATNSPILAGAAAHLRDQMPELSLTVRSVYASSDIVDLLERGEVDAAIAADYPGLELRHSGAIAHRGIVTEPTFVALPARHRLRDRVQIALAELCEEDWFLTPDDGAGWPEVFYAACQAAGFGPVRVHEFLGDQAQLQIMIADGLGISPVQATIRPTDGVIIKALVGTPLWCRYLLAWRRDSVPETVVDVLFGSATAAYRSLIAQAPHFQTWAQRTYRTTTRP